MKKITAFLLLYMLFQSVYSQNIIINHTFVSDTIIYPFSNEFIYGLNLSGSITLNSDSSVVRVILTDNYNNQYLIYESYTLIDTLTFFRKIICAMKHVC